MDKLRQMRSKPVTAATTTHQPFLQPKLPVKKQEDQHEQEADTIADRTAAMQQSSPRPFFTPKPAVQKLKSGVKHPAIQLFPDYETWKGSQKKEPAEENKLIQEYLQEMVKAVKQVFKILEGYDLTSKVKLDNVKDADLKSLLLNMKNLNSKKNPAIVDLNSAAETLTSLEEKAASVQNTFPLLELPGELIQRIFSFIPITGRVTIQGASKYLKQLVDTSLVFRMRTSLGNATIYVTFQDITNYMKDYQYSGLHGSSDFDKTSLYQGLKERKEDKDKVYKTSQLGPGFYLTDGKGPIDKAYAKSVAQERARMTKTEAVVFRVFINTQNVESVQVPREQWSDMKKDKTPDSLTKLSEQSKLLKAPIVQNEHVNQIKVNSSLFSLIRILPPGEKMDQEFYNWIRALCERDEHGIGTIEYDKK